MAENRESSALRAATIIVAILVPIAAVGGYLLASYLASREQELTRRNTHTLAAVARQLTTRLEAGTLAWGTACARGSVPEQIDLPGLERPAAEKQAASSPSGTADQSGGMSVPVRRRVRDRSIHLRAGNCRAVVSLPKFVRGTLPVPKVFDGIVLATRDGRILGQAGKATTPETRVGDFARLDDQGKNVSGGVDVPLGLAAPQQVLFGGDRHLVYVQHLLTVDSTELVLLGIVRSDRLRTEQWVLPYWSVLALAGLIVIVGLSWPILKLWFMGPSERLRNVDVRVLVVTSLLVTAVVAVFLVGALTVWGANRVLDERMRDLAREVETRLTAEVEAARAQLSQLVKAVRSQHTTSGPTFDGIDCAALAKTIRSSGSATGPAVLVDEAGKPGCRLEPDANTGTLDVWHGETPWLGDRQYFKDALAGNLAWRGTTDGIERYTVEMVKSKLTGADMLAAAAPLPWDTADRTGARPHMVMVASRHLTGFRRPIFPRGFSFVVLDGHGRVQLHADPHRSLDENLLDEVADPRELEASLAASRPRLLRLKYQGGAHQALVRPAAFGPWTLIVMLDDQALQMVLTEVITRWAVGFMLFALPGMLALGALQIVHAGYQAPWLWPSRDQIGTRGYLTVTGAIMAATIGGVAAFSSAEGRTRGLALFALPWVVLLITYGVLYALRRQSTPALASDPSGDDERRFRFAYVSMVWMMLIALSGVPSALLWIDVADMTFAELDEAVEQSSAAAVQAQRTEVQSLCAVGAAQCPQDGELAVQRGTYPWERSFSTSSPDPYLRPFSLGIRNLMPVYSDLAARLRAVSEADIRPIGTRFMPLAYGVPPAGLVLVPSKQYLLSTLVVFVAVWLGAMGVVWSVVTRLFLLDADRPDVLDALPCPSHVMAVWLYTHALEPNELGETTRAVLDVRWIGSAAALAQWFKDPVPGSHRVVVGLESRLGDKDYETALLDAVEAHVDRGAKLVLAWAADPLRRLESLREDDQGWTGPSLARWARVLARFRVTRLDLAETGGDSLQTFLRASYPTPWPPSGRATEANDQVTAAWNRTIWDQSTRREQVALRHLADEAFLSPADVETARALFRRRLIARDGQIVFATPSFRRFVQRAASDVDMRRLERKIGESTWARVNPFLQGALALSGAILLWTQEELRTTTVALPAAVTSALPLLVRLIGKLGSEDDAAKSGK